MSAASIAFVQPRVESYNGPREVFLLDRCLTKLETYVYSTIPHLATKADLKEEVGKLDNKIETVRTEIETVRTEVEAVRTEIQKEQKENRAWLLKASITLFFGFFTVLGGLGALFFTSQNRMERMEDRMERIEVRMEERFNQLQQLIVQPSISSPPEQTPPPEVETPSTGAAMP